MKLNYKTYDVEFNYFEDGTWWFGSCLVECLGAEQIEDTLLSKYEDVEVIGYVEAEND